MKVSRVVVECVWKKSGRRNNKKQEQSESSTQASLARSVDKACYRHFQASPQANVSSYKARSPIWVAAHTI
jgi:hypothetical protein